MATQPYSATLENLAKLADRALASEKDEKESQLGVAEIQLNKSAKVSGFLGDLSRRLNKLKTSAAKKKHYSHKQFAKKIVKKKKISPDVQAKLLNLMFLKIIDRVFFLRLIRFVVLTLRRRLDNKIMLLKQPVRPMHLSAIITKHSVIKRARAENHVRFL